MRLYLVMLVFVHFLSSHDFGFGRRSLSYMSEKSALKRDDETWVEESNRITFTIDLACTLLSALLRSHLRSETSRVKSTYP